MSQPVETASGGPDLGQTPLGTVLVASGDTDLLLDIEGELRVEGYEVIMTRDGGGALRLARKHFPTLLILDASLPGPSGVEVSRRLRSDWRFLDRGIVLLSGEPLSAQRELLMAGADDVVSKPVDPEALADRVSLAFRRLQEMGTSSPLSGLPGNPSIERELRRRTSQGLGVALAYLDIDDFKAFNDHYGFFRGDEMIRALADVIREAAGGRTDAFVGHVGGDDFVLLAPPDQIEHIAREVVSSFEAVVSQLYDPEDAARGWIEARDRQGRQRRSGLLTLSVGVALASDGAPADHRLLIDAATEMKRYAKTRPGSVIAVDRRTAERPAVPTGTPRLVRARGRRGRAAQRGRRVLTVLAATLLLAGVMAGPAFAMVENSSPGEILWPLKLRIESIRLALEGDATKDVLLHLEFASRRTMELQVVVLRGETSLVRTVVEDLERHNRSAVFLLEEAEASGLARLEMFARAATVFRTNVITLQELLSTECPEPAQAKSRPAACPELRAALGSSNEALDTVDGDGGTPGNAGEEPTLEEPPRPDGGGDGGQEPGPVVEVPPPDQGEPVEDPGTAPPPPPEEDPADTPPPTEEPPPVEETPPPTDGEEPPGLEDGTEPPGLDGTTPAAPDPPPDPGTG
jgi:diguanylate cyclase (GGDEF)-like protein